MLAINAKLNLEVGKPIDIKDLPSSGAKLASLVGVGPLTLSASDQAALKDWLIKGGTLLVEAVGGNREFDTSAREVVGKMFPDAALRRMATVTPPLGLPESPITRVKYRSKTATRLGAMREPNLMSIVVEGRPIVIYSGEDISGGLLGLEGATLDGYNSDSAYAIMRNIMVWAAK